MNYTFVAQTDRGRVRANNEDAVDFDVASGLAVLADGMGGYKAGEVASAMATGHIKTELARWLQASGEPGNLRHIRQAAQSSVANANTLILDSARANPEHAGMGTTLVVAIFCGSHLILGHVGDSRCYRLRDGVLLQLTRDHSVLQEQIDAGLLTPAQAALSSDRNLVTRALGVENAAKLELNDFPVQDGDLYLLCSDGLTDMVQDTGIAAALRQRATLDQTARDLVQMANQNGGRDNIAVVLVRANEAKRRRHLLARLLGRS
jgi:serine/threonine protein phosphatase PrpC